MKLFDAKPGDIVVIKNPSQKPASYIVCKIGNTPGLYTIQDKTICVNLETGRLVQKFNHLEVELVKRQQLNGNQ